MITIHAFEEDAKVVMYALLYSAHSYDKVEKELALMSHNPDNQSITSRGDRCQALASQITDQITMKDDQSFAELSPKQIQSILQNFGSDGEYGFLIADLPEEIKEDGLDIIGNISMVVPLKIHAFEIAEDDIDVMVAALKFCESRYLNLVTDLVQLNRNHKNQEILPRSYKCDDLRSDIEYGARDGKEINLGLLKPARFQYILDAIRSDERLSHLASIDLKEWDDTDTQYFKELLKNAQYPDEN